MSVRIVSTDKAPAAVGPYSQGVAGGGLLFTAMQIALDPKSGEMVGKNAGEQVRRCLENVRAVLETAGATLGDVIKTTVYLVDMSEFGSVNEVYGEFFSDHLPARGVVEVSTLPKGALVAVEAVAVAD